MARFDCGPQAAVARPDRPRRVPLLDEAGVKAAVKLALRLSPVLQAHGIAAQQQRIEMVLAPHVDLESGLPSKALEQRLGPFADVLIDGRDARHCRGLELLHEQGAIRARAFGRRVDLFGGRIRFVEKPCFAPSPAVNAARSLP